MNRLPLFNAIFPGSGLVVMDRLLLGLGLLLACLMCIAVVALAELVAGDGLANTVRLSAAGSYLGLAAIASLLWWLLESSKPVDDDAVRTCYQSLSTAYLKGDAGQALVHARQLVQLNPRHPGTWKLLAIIFRTLGDERGTKHALARQQRCVQRETL